MYQPGATGLPVQRISNFSTSWVVPPKISDRKRVDEAERAGSDPGGQSKDEKQDRR